MKQIEKVLKENYQLSHPEWEIVKNYIDLIAIKKNEFFVKQGKVCRRLGLIEEGVMRFCMFKEDGEDITCYFASEGDFVGDYDSFMTEKPSEINLQALTDCRLSCFRRELKEALPRFMEIMECINKNVLMGLLTQREFMMNQDATSKYELFVLKFPQVLQRAPLGHIASFLGITQQSLSRLRKKIS